MTTTAVLPRRRDLLALLGLVGCDLALKQARPALAQALAPRPDVARTLKIEAPTEASVAPYGSFLGKSFPTDDDPAAFRTPTGMAVWRQQIFDVGDHGDVEIVWVNHKGADPIITRLEQHHLTEQAVVPLTGDLIHIVALSTPSGEPDLASMRAFRLTPGVGLCMGRDVWHASRSNGITLLMLTRGSTSIDMARYQKHTRDTLSETSLQAIPPIGLADPI